MWRSLHLINQQECASCGQQIAYLVSQGDKFIGGHAIQDGQVKPRLTASATRASEVLDDFVGVGRKGIGHAPASQVAAHDIERLLRLIPYQHSQVCQFYRIGDGIFA